VAVKIKILPKEVLFVCRFYHFITKEEIPLKVIAQSILMRYPLENVTRYVQDSKKGYIYYLCSPGVRAFKNI